MEAKNIDEMTNDELVAEAATLKETLFKYRFQLATGQIENPSKIRAARKQVARLKTALRARTIKARTSEQRT